MVAKKGRTEGKGCCYKQVKENHSLAPQNVKVTRLKFNFSALSSLTVSSLKKFLKNTTADCIISVTHSQSRKGVFEQPVPQQLVF